MHREVVEFPPLKVFKRLGGMALREMVWLWDSVGEAMIGLNELESLFQPK